MGAVAIAFLRQSDGFFFTWYATGLVVVGDLAGTVQRVGLKTTRIQSLSGEQLVISNTDLLNSRIHNFKRMTERRVLFTIGVTYDTAPDKLRAIPGLIEEIIRGDSMARFDRAHFVRYDDFALTFEIVYYVRTPDYNAYMDTQQAINLELHRRFEEKGIEFAYPTQTLFVERAGGERPAEQTPA